MKAAKAKAINQVFIDACEEFGDESSTEFIISITAERTGMDYDSVVHAMMQCAKKVVDS